MYLGSFFGGGGGGGVIFDSPNPVAKAKSSLVLPTSFSVVPCVPLVLYNSLALSLSDIGVFSVIIPSCIKILFRLYLY